MSIFGVQGSSSNARLPSLFRVCDRPPTDSTYAYSPDTAIASRSARSSLVPTSLLLRWGRLSYILYSFLLEVRDIDLHLRFLIPFHLALLTPKKNLNVS